MHIAFVIPYFYPAWEFGGPPRSAYELARGLTERGHKVTVLTTDTCGSARVGKQWINRRLDGIEVVHFRNFSNSFAFKQRMSIVPGLGIRLRKHLRDVDVVHLHEYRSLVTVAGVNACKARGVPYVLSPHGGLKPLGKVLAKQVFDRLWGKRILENASRIAAVSPMEEIQALEIGVPAHAIRTMPNAVRVGQFETLPPSGRFRERWSIKGSKIVLFIGRLNWIKGADLVVRALTNNDVHLVLAGPDDGQETELRNAVRDLGLDTRVTFTGFLDDEEKLSAFVDARLTVVPSRSEIFSMTIMESLLCARPVLVSSTCGFFPMPDYDRGVIQFRGGDVQDLSKQMNQALDDQVLAANAEQGRRFAIESFAVDRVTRMAERMYLEIIDSGQE